MEAQQSLLVVEAESWRSTSGRYSTANKKIFSQSFEAFDPSKSYSWSTTWPTENLRWSEWIDTICDILGKLRREDLSTNQRPSKCAVPETAAVFQLRTTRNTSAFTRRFWNASRHRSSNTNSRKVNTLF